MSWAYFANGRGAAMRIGRSLASQSTGPSGGRRRIPAVEADSRRVLDAQKVIQRFPIALPAPDFKLPTPCRIGCGRWLHVCRVIRSPCLHCAQLNLSPLPTYPNWPARWHRWTRILSRSHGDASPAGFLTKAGISACWEAVALSRKVQDHLKTGICPPSSKRGQAVGWTSLIPHSI